MIRCRLRIGVRSIAAAAVALCALPSHAGLPPISFDMPTALTVLKNAEPSERRGADEGCNNAMMFLPIVRRYTLNPTPKARVEEIIRGWWDERNAPYWERAFGVSVVNLTYEFQNDYPTDKRLWQDICQDAYNQEFGW